MLALSLLPSSFAPPLAAARPTIPGARSAPVMLDSAKIFRPAQFWESETASMLDLINVIGRWDSSCEWAERTKFAVVQVTRDENMAQGASLERYEFAQRNKLAERVAMVQNVPDLPFKNEKLAASVGKTVAEMNSMPVSETAMGIVYDALAQSRSSLIPLAKVDERRKSWINADGTLNEGLMATGLYKSRLAVTVGFILLGKGQLYGAVFVTRIFLDITGAFEAVQSVIGSYAEPLYWVLSLAVAAYAIQQSMEVTDRTSDFKLLSKEEAEKEEERLKGDPNKSPTVFGRKGGLLGGKKE